MLSDHVHYSSHKKDFCLINFADFNPSVFSFAVNGAKCISNNKATVFVVIFIFYFF